LKYLGVVGKYLLTAMLSQFSLLPRLQKSITLFEGPQTSVLPRLLIVALVMKSMEHWLANIDGKPAVLVKTSSESHCNFSNHKSTDWPDQVSVVRGWRLHNRQVHGAAFED
jgi:hypothetical protein